MVGTPFLVIIVVFIMVIVVVRKNKVKKDNDKLNEEKEDYKIEMETVFFDKAENGSKTYKFLSVNNQYDIMFIKSLFQSEQIPYYIEFENMASLKPGLKIDDYNNSNIYILEDDYDDALIIIMNYLKSKNTENYNSKNNTIRNIAEVIVGGWFITSSDSKNGVRLYLKDKK